MHTGMHMNLSLSDPYEQRIIKYLPSGSQHFKAEQFTYYDEHIAPQIIQLGSFIFDANKSSFSYSAGRMKTNKSSLT